MRDFTHVILILLAREIVLFSRVLTNVETLRFEGKQDLVYYFPREQTLSVLLYNDEKIYQKHLYSYNNIVLCDKNSTK